MSGLFTSPARAARMAAAAVFAALMAATAAAQTDDRGGAPAPAADPNAVLSGLSKVVQVTAAARKCGWSTPDDLLAAETMHRFTQADLKATVPAASHPQIDAALDAARASVGGFACKTPDGADAPQKGQVELYVADQYWRMIAHVDVLGSYRWGKPFRFTSEERTALDREIARIREVKGYGYWAVGNPLETLADKTAALACRERPPEGKMCKPVPAELEGNATTVKLMLELTETFGKSVAAGLIQRQAAFRAAVGDISKFSVIGDAACEPGTRALKTGDALVHAKVTEDAFGQLTNEVMFAETFRLGEPARTGWVLLFRSFMQAGDAAYFVLAEDGGDWDEESARNGAGEVNTLSDTIRADIASRDLPPDQEAAMVAAAKATLTETYFDNFVSMGLMKSLGGDGSIQLNACTAD